VDQTTWRVAQVLAILQLLKALELHGVYTILWARLTTDQPMLLLDWAVSLASVLFLLFPIAAVIGLFRRRRWGFYPLILFPIVAVVFGAIPVPFAAHLYSSDVYFMSKVIIVVNLIFIGVYVLLFRDSRPRTGAYQ
jgi:hypothetical protein